MCWPLFVFIFIICDFTDNNVYADFEDSSINVLIEDLFCDKVSSDLSIALRDDVEENIRQKYFKRVYATLFHYWYLVHEAKVRIPKLPRFERVIRKVLEPKLADFNFKEDNDPLGISSLYNGDTLKEKTLPLLTWQMEIDAFPSYAGYQKYVNHFQADLLGWKWSTAR